MVNIISKVVGVLHKVFHDVALFFKYIKPYKFVLWLLMPMVIAIPLGIYFEEQTYMKIHEIYAYLFKYPDFNPSDVFYSTFPSVFGEMPLMTMVPLGMVIVYVAVMLALIIKRRKLNLRDDVSEFDLMYYDFLKKENIPFEKNHQVLLIFKDRGYLYSRIFGVGYAISCVLLISSFLLLGVARFFNYSDVVYASLYAYRSLLIYFYIIGFVLIGYFIDKKLYNFSSVKKELDENGE